LIFKHVGDDQIEAVVDPETLDLIGPQTDSLIEFLKNVNIPIKYRPLKKLFLRH
jgi:hypothetical protein